ncbi:unknown protein (Partial), partial [Seminavis robusta]|eukprot:Sro572_g168900.1 n/a (385) ;mRNA; f:57693-58849
MPLSRARTTNSVPSRRNLMRDASSRRKNFVAAAKQDKLKEEEQQQQQQQQQSSSSPPIPMSGIPQNGGRTGAMANQRSQRSRRFRVGSAAAALKSNLHKIVSSKDRGVPVGDSSDHRRRSEALTRRSGGGGSTRRCMTTDASFRRSTGNSDLPLSEIAEIAKEELFSMAEIDVSWFENKDGEATPVEDAMDGSAPRAAEQTPGAKEIPKSPCVLLAPPPKDTSKEDARKKRISAEKDVMRRGSGNHKSPKQHSRIARSLRAPSSRKLLGAKQPSIRLRNSSGTMEHNNGRPTRSKSMDMTSAMNNDSASPRRSNSSSKSKEPEPAQSNIDLLSMSIDDIGVDYSNHHAPQPPNNKTQQTPVTPRTLRRKRNPPKKVQDALSMSID